MMSLSEALTFGEIMSEIRSRGNEKPHYECCYCNHMETQVEAIGPGEGLILHRCSITGERVEYGQSCVSGKFERKE